MVGLKCSRWRGGKCEQRSPITGVFQIFFFFYKLARDLDKGQKKKTFKNDGEESSLMAGDRKCVEQLCVVLMHLGHGNCRLMARKSTGSTRLQQPLWSRP